MNPTLNPEVMALLVNGITAAQYAAQIAAVMATLTLLVVLVLGLVMGWMVYNFSVLKHQTNSIVAALLKVTGDEALARGLLEGRAEKNKEEGR